MTYRLVLVHRPGGWVPLIYTVIYNQPFKRDCIDDVALGENAFD